MRKIWRPAALKGPWPRVSAARRVVALIAVVGLAGCGGPGGAATPGPAGVLFQDDFSQTTSGWDTHTGADVITNYEDGRYLIAVEEPGVSVWARPGLELTDVVLEADSQYGAGPVNNEYGLLCRYTRGGDGTNSFYFFFVSSDGYYALGKVVRDVRTVLNPDDGSFQPADAVVQGPEASNHLTATCDGTHFSLAVNGTVVGEFDDDELPRGDVGVIAGTFDEGGVRIYFDNVVVRQPA
jgi:hypothetical protein